MFLIIGTKYLASGSERTHEQMRCGNCGIVSQFVRKSGRRFLTVFFVIPVFPLGGKKELLECPNCKTRYEAH